ncbi:hypothetical protein QMK19_39030 [Streptomyces sp. H10-C2]|uniref:hypothetical protein n=1 Tax=unclassified Streptomyces TaxID=2593676 RepID=UPI0024B8E7ED|nr:MULTISPECIES: hypothetical protein [unclassified Streptomyces]MDJ0347171.1 hypothetical protein [Streptomyces sp. PH10-H1]MDJ0375430.1 hypothetical protein [Streptomyces sp. H10-C2]
MSHPTPYPVRLADEISRQLDQLAKHLTHLPAHEATQVIARILDPDHGLLGGVTHLIYTGSVFAKDQAERGALPAEVWLALGRAATDLANTGADLEEYRDALRHVSTQPASGAGKPPAPASLVVRRHR